MKDSRSFQRSGSEIEAESGEETLAAGIAAPANS
jgi:hypothetical protein